MFSNNNGDNNDANNNDVDNDNDIIEVIPPLPPVSHKNALLAIEKVKLYFEQITINRWWVEVYKKYLKNVEFNSKNLIIIWIKPE